ncbi:MAG: hypothetical protein ACI4CT_03570 [Lachnospiraceae bacterium]
MDVFGRIMTMIASIVILFWLPVVFFGNQQKHLMEVQAEYSTVRFVDSVRTSGRITPEMYQEYQEQLGLTRQFCQSSMEHERNIYLQSENGDIAEYPERIYHDDIVETLYGAKTSYDLETGDFFSVSLSNGYRYGGLVRDENYET